MKAHVPAWLQGASIANATWLATILLAYAFEAGEQYFPKWLRDIDVPDTLGSLFSLISFPIPVAGWLLIWGDRVPPYKWIESLPFNICFGICFYALLGASVGYHLERKSQGRVRFWKLLAVIVTLMFSIGAIPLLWEWID